MINVIFRSITVTLVLGSILCGAYPLFVYGVGHLLFHDKASGGIIEKNGKIVGAKLIGQGFSQPEYFHSRPSAAGEKGYDASNSLGSNLGPTNQKLYDTLKSHIDSFLRENPDIKKGEIPTDIVTSSGSGLDPHISPSAAYAQASRVANTRGVSGIQMKSLVQEYIQGPQLGLFGEPVVNVLVLNMALDEKFPLRKHEGQTLTRNSN